MNETNSPAKNASPAREIGLGTCTATMVARDDGCKLVENTSPLTPYPRRMTDRLDHWAQVAPDRVWLAERAPDGEWRKLTYSQARTKVRQLAAALLQRDLSPERPVVILSGNSIDHAMLGMAAQVSGIPYAPVSPAYSLISTDHSKLKYILELLTPGLIFAADGALFGKAISNAIPADMELVVAANPPQDRPVTDFARLFDASDDARVDAAHSSVGPETIAKFLFTSGSTGMPKAVINTQLMMCSNMSMTTDHFAFMRDEPPVTLDWSPWNHTAGGNHNFNLFLHNGGTLYIDEGKPVPGAIEATIRNLRDVSPTWYFNIPKGFDAMLPYLEEDEALRNNLFRRLRMFWYAGAGMAQHIWDKLDELSIKAYGERVLILTGLGSTETAPFAMAASENMVGQGNIGIPARASQLKLVPADGKWEARFRGPHITPGYWRQPELTANAFDEEGFYKIGDALRFADPDDVNRGFYFDGRTAENFKLSSGTWVAAGALRAQAIDHCAPYVQDAVVTGLDKDYIGLLIFPDLAGCAGIVGDGGEREVTIKSVAASTAVREAITAKLNDLAAQSTGSSTRIARALVLNEQPSIDKGELTDKGSLNQRAVRDNREEQVAMLYQDPAPASVIIINK